MGIYDLRCTAEQLAAAAAWIITGDDMADVDLLADDRMLLVSQGDDRTAFDTGGEPGSDEYLAVAPLDRGGPTAAVREWEVAGDVRIVVAATAEEAVARAIREWDEETDDKYAVNDPNPSYETRPLRDRGTWQQVYAHDAAVLPPDDEYSD